MPRRRLPRSWHRWSIAARIVAAAAIIVGLLGMHVLMSPATHAAHMTAAADGSAMAAFTVSPQSHHDGSAAAAAMTDAAALDESCTGVCADPSSRGSSHGQDHGIWTVICVLALLLTVLLVVPSQRSWQSPWRLLPPAGVRSVGGIDSAPRHPPSLTLLSISRT
ncbi:MAG TPA: DUF6153 family protein [Microbacterium sp.]|jgi:uncharacterized integral membrane protein|uniref:DUF6153 family protein n=1 Tax=Microbacterium sp. TaxID=51671 RepID=UPI002F92BA2E